MRRPERGADLLGLSVQPPLPPGLLQGGDDSCPGQSPSLMRSGSLRKHRQGLRSVQVIPKGLERCRVELPEDGAQGVHLALAGPDQVLMTSGEDLYRLGQFAVSGDQPVILPVGANQLGEHLGVARVGLGSRDGVAFPVPTGSKGIDRKQLVSAGNQGFNEQSPVGLDAHHHLGRFSGMIGNQGMELADALKPFRHPSFGENLALLIQDAQIVMGLSPVVTDEDQLLLLSSTFPDEPKEHHRRTNGSVLKARHPTSRFGIPYLPAETRSRPRPQRSVPCSAHPLAGPATAWRMCPPNGRNPLVTRRGFDLVE